MAPHGVLEPCLLALLADGEAYGYELAARLADQGLGRVAGGTLYPALRRLEKQDRLEARGVSAATYGEILVETEGFLDQSGDAAVVHFGAPAEYAMSVASAVTGERTRRRRRRTDHVVRISGITRSYRGNAVLTDVSLALRHGGWDAAAVPLLRAPGVVNPFDDIARTLPFWSSRELTTYAVDGAGQGSLRDGLIHALVVIGLCVLVAATNDRLRSHWPEGRSV